MFSVILPAAGKGTRLGLPYPKELHRISETHSLIDLSLDHVRANAELVSNLSIVVTEEKQPVFDYVRSVVPETTQLNRVFFNDAYTEWPGSILSAEDTFDELNFILLPDSRLKPRGNETLAQKYNDAFDNGADIVFAYCPEQRPARLTALGALRIDDGMVTRFQDKPTIADAHLYNGFWASFGFRKSIGPGLLKFMMKSVAKDPASIFDLGCKIAAFPVQSYQDLGTWPNLNKFVAQEAREKSNADIYRGSHG